MHVMSITNGGVNVSMNTYIGVIKNETCNLRTLVNAENEMEALKQVAEKFMSTLVYAEKDIAIMPFSTKYGRKGH